MSSVLHISIEKRQQTDCAALDIVSSALQREFFVEQLAISTTAQGYSLVLADKQVALQAGDCIYTPHHKLMVAIKATSKLDIAFDPRRAPVRTLSDQWQQAGLDPFMSSQLLPDNAIIPLSTELSPADPLDFLSKGRQAMPASQLSNIAPLPGAAINWSPQSSHYFTAPESQSNSDLGPLHCSQFNASPSMQHPFTQQAAPTSLGQQQSQVVNHNSNTLAQQAPIDLIDTLYQENQRAVSTGGAAHQPQVQCLSRSSPKAQPHWIHKIRNITGI